MRTLGLDVSTSIVGFTVLEDETPLKIGHVDFKKCNDLWEKADHVKAELEKLIDEFKPDQVYVEESLLGFSSGLSSAGTLFTLAKFNALVSYFMYKKTGKPVTYVAANSARKTVGIKLIPKKKCGVSHKQQAFDWALAGPLASHPFPKTRTGSWKGFVFDEVDSFVIALAGAKLNKPPVND